MSKKYPVEYKINRDKKIKENPYCEICGNPTREVHHQDLSKDNHNLENLMSVCKKCHVSLHPKRNNWEISWSRGCNKDYKQRSTKMAKEKVRLKDVSAKISPELYERVKRISKTSGIKIKHLIETGLEVVIREYEHPESRK